MRISNGAEVAGVTVTGTPNRYRVKDVFTTHNGSWQPDENDVYSLPDWAFEQPDHPGGAEHIYVRMAAATPENMPLPWVTFAISIVSMPQMLSRYRWTNMPTLNTYSPPAQSGWRHWLEEDGQIVLGGGLPNGEHVSLFVIWELNIEPDEEPDEPDEDKPGVTYVHIPADGHTVVIDSHGYDYFSQNKA